MEEWMDSRHISAECAWKKTTTLYWSETLTLIKISYLSNYQSSIFGGCGGLVTLRVLNSGLGRLRLTITQLSAKTPINETISHAWQPASVSHSYVAWLWAIYELTQTIPGSGIFSTRGGLLSCLLIHLLVIFFVCGSRLLARGGVVSDLVRRPHIIYGTKLLG